MSEPAGDIAIETLEQATTVSPVAVKSTEKAAQPVTTTPVVSKAEEVYHDEKEKRLAEFVKGMEKKRADANGAAARQVREAMIDALVVEGEKVSLSTSSS